jgi:hypothetical protein
MFNENIFDFNYILSKMTLFSRLNISTKECLKYIEQKLFSFYYFLSLSARSGQIKVKLIIFDNFFRLFPLENTFQSYCSVNVSLFCVLY